jgi:5-hydroxyisourate hydrolase-like protein (transthyretin family)
MLKIATLLLLVQLGTSSEIPQQQHIEKASIEGVVLRSGSGEPLGRAQVRLLRVLPDDFTFYGGSDPETNGLPSVLTESDGKFLLKDLDPGQYRMTVVRNGYGEQSYGQKTAKSPGMIINLISGEVMKNVVFRLIPAGTVTGRVLDTAGEPIAGLSVALMRIEYGRDGRKNLWTENAAQTDDRGEYRLYWVKSGRYYMRVSRSDYTSRPVVTDPNFVRTYYPGVSDLSNASIIELPAGSELSGIDIILSKPSGHWIRGRVMDSSGKPPKSVDISVHHKQAATVVDVESEFGERGGGVYNPTNGTFEIPNVTPGSYWLSASTSRDYDAPISGDRLADIRTGQDVFNVMFSTDGAIQIPIDMPASDLKDVVLTLAKGSTIPVLVSVEGRDLSSVNDMDKLRLALMPAGEGYGDYHQSTRLNAQGAAKIENVLPGEYMARVDQPKSTNLYAKEIRYGQNDALHYSFQITDLLPGTLTVLLSDQAGRIEGTLIDALSQPVSGIQVVLIPDVRKEKSSSFQTANSDRDGHFVFTVLPPGGYKLFSWEDLESNAYYDNEVLSKYEAQGKPVQVQEASKVIVDLKIIPATRQ